MKKKQRENIEMNAKEGIEIAMYKLKKEKTNQMNKQKEKYIKECNWIRREVEEHKREIRTDKQKDKQMEMREKETEYMKRKTKGIGNKPLLLFPT